MKHALIINNQFVRFLKDSYQNTYPGGKLKANEQCLPVVDTPTPAYDSSTEKVINEGYVIENDQYVRKWRVEPLTELELAERDWHGNIGWAKRIVVPALKSLKMQMANVLTYWDDEGMPRAEQEGLIFLYCKEILPEHQPFIDAANSQLNPAGYAIVIEDRPEILENEQV